MALLAFSCTQEPALTDASVDLTEAIPAHAEKAYQALLDKGYAPDEISLNLDHEVFVVENDVAFPFDYVDTPTLPPVEPSGKPGPDGTE